MLKKYKSQLIIGLIILILVSIASIFHQSKIETIEEQKLVIQELKSKLTILKQESLKISSKIVIVKKPDGSVVTTKTRNVEKNLTVHKDVTKTSDLKVVSDLKTKTLTNIFNNAVGLKPTYERDEGFDVEIYLQSGLKCFMFRCYAEVGYKTNNNVYRISTGVEYRF